MEGYFLHYEIRPGKPSSIRLDRFPFTIGRDPDNHLVIEGGEVSRHHASLRSVEGSLCVFDHQSRNGVYVNNQRIRDSQSLRAGDVLRIGVARLTLNHRTQPHRQEIPERPRGAETVLFVSSSDNWDPIKSLSPSSTPAIAPPRRGGQSPAARSAVGSPLWHSILSQLFLEAPIEEAYERIFDLVEQTVSSDRCAIILFERGLFEGGGPSEGAAQEGIRVVARRLRVPDPPQFFVSVTLLRQVAKSREAVLITANDPPVIKSASFIQSGATTAIGVPLIVSGSVSGVLYLDRLSSTQSLQRNDIEVLGPLAGLVALKLDKQQMAGIRRDLNLAKTIQESLFPHAPPSIAGYALEGFTSPCLQVGGDYFDYVAQKDGRVALLIGDVSGKGLPAAMYMASVRANLHAHLESEIDPGSLISRLERHVLGTFRSDHFLTIFAGRLDPATGHLEYCNAGHPPPIALLPDDQVLEFAEVEPALNLMAWGKFHTSEHRIEPGEVLLLYTDGLVEEENGRGEQFGRDRLIDGLRRWRDRPPGEIRRELLAAIDAHCGGRGPSDDRTLIVLRRDRR